MPSFDDNAAPGDVRWAVTRGTTNGDHPRKVLGFFDAYYGDDDPRNVPANLTGLTYTSTVSTGRMSGDTVITAPTATVDLLLGEVTMTMTDEQTRLLTNSTYIWDLVENLGTTTELTLVTGRMTVAGRATP